MDEDEDCDFEPDYVEDFELGPKRPYYPKAAPTLALPNRLAAYKYVGHITRFMRHFTKVLNPHMLRNGRSVPRLALARIGDEYFVLRCSNGRSESPPPAEVGMYGCIQLYPSTPPKLLLDFQLYYEDPQKLREKHRRMYALTANPSGFIPIMVLGEQWQCTHLMATLNSYGDTVEGTLAFHPDISLFGVHARLHKAERTLQPRFQRYCSHEQEIESAKNLQRMRS